MANEELVYVGIKGRVVALRRATGQIVWDTNLDAGFLNSSFVHVVVDGNDVYASTQGEVSCLDAATGRIRWQNALRGYGMGIASIATRNTSSPSNLVAQIIAQQQADAAAASSSSH